MGTRHQCDRLATFISAFCVFGAAVSCTPKTARPAAAQVAATTVALPSAKAHLPLATGAERTAEYLPLLRNKRVAVVTNHSGRIGTRHLVDSLLALGVRVVKVFAPEHGFRGTADAGASIKDQHDETTGLPVLSLYGATKKPSAAALRDVDLLLFDIQDVGVRFYTYISTLHYVMEAAAERGKPLIVLDRPNPNGAYFDGPVLEPSHRSFVGMHAVPLVHGNTIGEYARMINGEGWLAGGKRCELSVIPCSGYDHTTAYPLPVPPSPNLRTMGAVYRYPSLGLLEGTVASVGRGTLAPFGYVGYPECTIGEHRFTPMPMVGSTDPPHAGKLCRGFDLTVGDSAAAPAQRLELGWLLALYQGAPSGMDFFNSFFDKLAGSAELRQQIIQGWAEERIRESWRPGLEAYAKVRAKYLLYE
jgi:uncharacterized protein YbbC (DUF1343 family)